MKRWLTAIPFGLALLALPAAADAPRTPRLKISIDYRMAEQTLALLENPAATREAAEKLLALPGTKGMIKHTAGFDPGATPEAFVTALLAAARGRPLADDRFHLPTSSERRAQVRDLLAAIRRDPSAFSAAVGGRLAEYSPPDLALQTQVYLVVGGGSDGFTTHEKIFYLALDMFRGELPAVHLMTTHELFHLVQQALIRRGSPAGKEDSKTPETPPELTRELLRSVVNEGTASLVADPTRLPDKGSWMAWMADKYRRNLDHIALNFTLVDTLIYRAFHDSTADGEALYRVGFSGSLDSLAYHVGYLMAQRIESQRGRPRLIQLIGRDPTDFFREYAGCRSGGDPAFSPAFAAILEKLAVR